MATKKTTIVKGETSSGIKYQIDTRVKDDTRFLYYLTKLQGKNTDELEKGQALMSILTLFFGSDEGLELFFNEVATKHNGIADIHSLMDELDDIFDALNVKNS